MSVRHEGGQSRRAFMQLTGLGLGALAVGSSFDQLFAQGRTLKIGSIGAGHMGGALAELFVKAGHQVMLSSRHPENLKSLAAKLGPLAQVGTVADAVAFGDVIVLVVPYPAIEEIGKTHGKAIASKALLLDISNPYGPRDGEAIVKWAEEQGGAGLATAKLIPGAKIVRAFNGISYLKVVGMAHQPGKNGVPIAGNDQKAIAMAETLIKGMGFEPVLIGGLDKGKHLLAMGPLRDAAAPDEIRRIAATLR